MVNMDKKAILDALVTNILNARFEKLDQSTVENAKNRILDVMGCMLGGSNAPGNPELVRLAADWGGKSEAIIIG